MSLITKLPFLLTACWRADSLGEIVWPGLLLAQDPLVKISSPALRPWPPDLQKGPLLPMEGGILDPSFLDKLLRGGSSSLVPPLPSSKGAASSTLVNTGSGMVSGRGARHRISFAFAIHSCSKDSSFKRAILI